MSFKVIVTIGPSLLGTDKLLEINQHGPCIYRINGAHTDPGMAQHIIQDIREKIPDARIMLDLSGNKIRTANLAVPLTLEKGEEFELHDYQINYPPFISLLQPGQLILADDSNLTLETLGMRGNTLRLLSHSSGLLRNNKGLHARGVHQTIPFLFKRDQELMAVACEERIAFISLSFVRNAADVREARQWLEPFDTNQPELFVKVETESAVTHLKEILETAHYFNIDRGDLASDIGLLNIPSAQQRVIRDVAASGKKIFLATQFLKNMETYPVPLISEICALAEAVQAGVHGIQLSEETAIGKYPVECVKLVRDIQAQYAQKGCIEAGRSLEPKPPALSSVLLPYEMTPPIAAGERDFAGVCSL